MLGARKNYGTQKIPQQFCVNRNGQKYVAEMMLSPVFSDSGDPTMFVGLVRNLSERHELREELEQYVHHAEQAAEVFSRELRQKNDLLNRQLASVFSTSLVAVGSDRQEALSRMLQVTSEMLGCQAGALRLIGKNPEGRDSLVLQQAYGYSVIWEERRRFLGLDEGSIAVECFLSKQPQIWRDIQDGSMGGELYESYFAKQLGLHSVVCFPLVLREQGVGILSLYRPTVREFTPSEVRLGQSIANYMAIILENFQLYEDMSAQAIERQQWLDAIHQVSVQLAGFESLDSLLQLAAQITKDRLNSEVSSIFLLEDDRLRKNAVAGMEADWLAEESYGIGEGITGSCLVAANGTKYGRPVSDNAVDQNPQVVKKHLREYQGKLESGQVKHLIVVPLNGREGPFGVLRVVNKLDEDGQLCETGFAQGDVNLLNTIACEVAIAVEKARLLEEAQRHAEELSQLQQSSQALLSSLDLQGVLNRVASLAANLVQADHTKVVLDEDDRLIVGAYSSRDSASPPCKPRSDGVTRQVVETEIPVIVDELSDGEPHNPELVEKGVRSYAGVPIIGQEKVLGALFVFSLRPCTFRGRIPLLRAFASQAAIAIKNSKLYELEQKRRRVEETLRETSRVVSSTLDLRDVLPLILDQVRSVVPYDTASIQLLSGDELEIMACRGFDDPDYVQTIVFPISPEFPNYQVVVNKEPYIVDDVRPRYASFRDESYRATHIRSWLGVPLLFKGQAIGMMSIDSRTPGCYSEEDANLALAFANQVAIAIKNAQLYKETKDRLSESIALLEVSKNLQEILDFEDLLQLVIGSAIRLIQSADGGVIHLFDNDTEKLLPRASSGVDLPSLAKATLMEIGHGIAGHAIRDLQTINVPDVNLDSRFDGSAQASYFRSLLVAPLYVGQESPEREPKRVGTISVHSKKVGAFTEKDRRLLIMLASQTATAVANLKLYLVREETRGKYAEILAAANKFRMDMGLEQLYKEIASTAREILGFNMVALNIFEPHQDAFIVIATSGLPAEGQAKLEGTAIPADVVRCLMDAAESVGRSCFIPRVSKIWDDEEMGKYGYTPDLGDRAPGEWHQENALLIPMKTSDKGLIGLLSVDDPVNRRLPSMDDIQVLEIFVRQATVAIENARLYEAEKRRATHMAVISEVAQDITSILELEELLPRIVESIERGFDYHHVALFLLGEMGRELVVHATIGAYADGMPLDHHIALRKGMVGWAAYTGETQLANDVKKDEHYIQGFPAAVATQAELSVPIKLAEHVIGVLDIQSDRLNSFDEMDVLAMETLSDQIAVAIENARLFSRVQQLKEFNENIVQDMEGGVLKEDAEGRINFVNPKMATMLGYSQAELTGQHWSKVVPPVWIEKVTEEAKKRSQGVKGRYEAALLHRYGTEIPVVVNANPLFEKGEFAGVLTVFTDIRETKRRLEDELHEAMNFFHAGVMLEIEAAQDRLEKEQYGLLKAELEQLWRASRHTYSELDKILLDLRDPILERRGLGPALEKYTRLVARDRVFVMDDFKDRLQPDTEHALFRIAQGAITNAVRHAGLEQVSGGKALVRLAREGENITLSIMDNGEGFDTGIMQRYTQAFGLVRMKEWAQALDTTLQIESAPGEGTKVMVTISAEEALGG
jgi:PAS domain S-box-containing protein